MKHIRVVSLSALLVACSSIGLEGENVVPGDSNKGENDERATNADAGADEDGDEPSEGTDGQQAAAEDAVPESTIVTSESELETLIAAGSSDGQAIGGVTLHLVDAPVDADAVNVTFCGVQVHKLLAGERPAEPRPDQMAPPPGATGAAAAGSVAPPVDMRADEMRPEGEAMAEPPPERLPEEKPADGEMRGETPPPEGLVPPDVSGAPAGMAPPRDMPPPADSMRPPPEMPKPEDGMRPPPAEGDVRPPAEDLPEDRDVMAADGGVVLDERPAPMMPDGGAPPPPPDRMPLVDGGMPVAEGMRPVGEVGATPPGHWLNISDSCVSVDLLALQEGVFEELGFAALPVGDYGQIRLLLTDAEVVVDGVAHPLTLPMGDEGGFKIEGGFSVEDGEITTLTVDFDAARSIDETERGEYVIKPVIFLAGEERRMVRPPQPGAVAGDVRDPAPVDTGKPMEPGREPAPAGSSDSPPPRGSAEPGKPGELPPPDMGGDMPPDERPGEPAVSGRVETAPPADSVKPRDMPPPSASGEPPMPPPPADGEKPPADREPPPSGQMPPPGSAPAASGLPPADAPQN